MRVLRKMSLRPGSNQNLTDLDVEGGEEEDPNRCSYRVWVDGDDLFMPMLRNVFAL